LTLAYTLLALANLGPAVLQPATRLAGENSWSSDVMESVWGLWWWRHALLDLHQSPLQISLLNYPAGYYFPLYPLMAQPYLLALPLTALVSPVFAYNMLQLFSAIACGLAGYALCREISGDSAASFVGGLIWAFFPARMIHAVAGHVAFMPLFWIPLVALGLISTFRAPSRAKSVLTGIAFVGAATINPTHLGYVLPPLMIGLVLNLLQAERRAFWRRDRLQALAIIAVVAGLPMACLLVPLVQQMLLGNQPVWSTSQGAAGFSPDALGFFVPSADNPLIQGTPLASFALKIMPYQYAFLIYAGWAPLLLALVGAWSQPAKGRLWAILAIVGAILALGPLLKLGGEDVRISIEGESYRLVMPYAFIMNWPFIQWSRTPGRLTVLVMLAVAVLAALGLQHLLKRLPRGLWTWLVAGIVSAVITAEYWVRFPFPSFSASTPAPLQALRTATDGRAVLQVPVNGYQDNQRMLYWQTIHQHPLIGGRVYRDDTEADQQYNFYRQLLLQPGSDSDVRTSLQALASGGVGWVIYDGVADPGDQVGTLLRARLGPPLAEDRESAVYRLSAAPLEQGASFWKETVTWESASGGERFCQQGEIGVMASNGLSGEQLTFHAQPATGPKRLTVRVNDLPVGRYVVGDEATFRTQPFTLTTGYNRIDFVDEGPLLTSPPVPAAICTPAGQTPVTWGPVISDRTLTEPRPAAPLATFGPALQLTGFSWSQQAHPGETLAVHLVWQTETALDDDLTVFIHLMDANQQLAAQIDAPPLGDGYPTSRWQPGEVVAAQLNLNLPADLAAGEYHLRLGVYRQSDFRRLEVTGAEAPDDILPLGQINIIP
jgi:hypothetical protein